MKLPVIRTNNDYALFFLRLALAVVIFPHGAQKLLGWFGGYGFTGTMIYFTQTREMPWLVGILVILIEFFVPLALLAGLATRFCSAALAGVMTGIILTTFRTHFFMDWFGTQHTEGYEYFLLTIGMSVALVLAGPGRLSLDARLSQQRN
ncbi:MAG: DoxX family protein [Bacteroidetes bacterium]|nr:DoxX family protein [Bacteroidota bacterium]